VVLAEPDWGRWLTPDAGEAESKAGDLMRPAPDDRVELIEVGPAVGNVRNDGPELIRPAGLSM
jgi:putative SOS response-associated peptidase YedK